MDKFTLYEFSALLLPGVILVYGLSLIYPGLNIIISNQSLSLGNLGLIVILSFTVGNLIQAFGNFIVHGWWNIRKGNPTEWIRQNKQHILAESQRDLIIEKIKDKLKIQSRHTHIEDFNSTEWANISRQIYTLLNSKNEKGRIDMFQANYGLYRGLTASLVILAIVIFIKYSFSETWLIILMLFLAMLSIYRMERFSKYYAKELFMCFINIP